MHHIERIGYVAQELAYTRRYGIGGPARGADAHDKRECHEETQRIVQAVHPQVFAAAYARHGRQRHDGHGTDPEGAAHTPRTEHAREQQSHRECIEQAQHAAHDIVTRHREAHAHVPQRPPQGKCRQPASGCGHQRTESLGRKQPQHESVQYVAYVLEQQRPARPVQRIHLSHAAHLHPYRRRNQQGVHQRGHGKRPDSDPRHVPHGTALEVEQRRTYQRPKHYQRVKADETPLEELPCRHARPTVVIGITHNEARQDEEEVDSQITVIDTLVYVARGESLEEMEADHRNGRNAAKAVENLVMLLGVGERRRRYSVWFHCTKVVAAAG